ncbi:MAG: RibD family protein, partial [Oscillospiraceae bacterium]|nr:RibD family protein [Oscillospiraceae bacterium]
GDEIKQKTLIERGCEIVRVPLMDNHINLQILMKILGDMGIDSILLEGGSTLNFSALECGIVHKVQTYIAPKIFGGANAKTPVGGVGISHIADCIKLKNRKISYLGEDILIESEVDYLCSRE